MIVHEINLHAGIVNFISTDEPCVFFWVEVFKAWSSFHVHCRYGQVWHSIEVVTLEYLLDLGALVEVENGEENLFLLLEISINTAFLHKRVNSLGVLSLNNFTMMAVGLHIKNDNYIVRPRVLNYILHVVRGSKFDNAIR